MKNYIDTTLLASLKGRFPSVSYDPEAAQPALYVPAEGLFDLLAFLRDYETCRFTRLEDLTAVDYKEYFEMVYHLFSLENMTWIVVKVKLEPAQPVVPSVTSVFHSAEFEEREVYDLMGIDFTGHPDLRRILLADDFVGHPLRKDYKQELPPVVPRIRKGGC